MMHLFGPDPLTCRVLRVRVRRATSGAGLLLLLLAGLYREPETRVVRSSARFA
jgi:hypothetical protein